MTTHKAFVTLDQRTWSVVCVLGNNVRFSFPHSAIHQGRQESDLRDFILCLLKETDGNLIADSKGNTVVKGKLKTGGATIKFKISISTAAYNQGYVGAEFYDCYFRRIMVQREDR